MTQLFSYYCFVLHQDLQTINLDEFRYGGTNITAFRLVDPYSQLVQNTVREWTKPTTAADIKVIMKPFRISLKYFLQQPLMFTEQRQLHIY